MQAIKTRLERLESKASPLQQPRLIVLNPGEAQIEALARLGISEDNLSFERQAGRKIVWVRWAG